MDKKNKSQCVIRFALGDIIESRGLSQRETAKRTGISKNAISVLAGEPQQIQIATLEKLCNGLGVKPTDLFVVEEVK